MKILSALVLLVGLVGTAHADCPSTVTDAIKKAFPDASVTKCKAEKKANKFEAKLKRKDGSKLEVDLASDGKVLKTEEKIDVAKLPAPVTKAFAAKYPKAKPSKAEKQVKTGAKLAFYEIKFEGDGKKKREATFDETGKFIAEE